VDPIVPVEDPLILEVKGGGGTGSTVCLLCARRAVVVACISVPATCGRFESMQRSCMC